MKTIRLQLAAWSFDEWRPLGRAGGFGAVFAGKSADGSDVAVKRLHLSREAAGHREMAMAADLARRDLRHVLAALDWGLDLETSSYYLVMPLAEGSLTSKVGVPVAEDEAVAILAQIAAGLSEVPSIVHRDLKPDNVLFHDGRWKLADFGIARFVEESTSANTLKDCLSPQYAAPEQWRFEETSGATDVYALGCIAHTLLSGAPPFSGRTVDELRAKHLTDVPPLLQASPRLRLLISACLKKSPGVRPSLPVVVNELRMIIERGARPASTLTVAAASVASKEAEEEAARRRANELRARRLEIAKEGLELLGDLVEGLFTSISEEAPTTRRGNRWSAVLGQGTLSVEVPFPVFEQNLFSDAKWDVAAGAILRVAQPSGRYRERSANLWFARAAPSASYRWFEVGLWTMHGTPRRPEPFGIANRSEIDDVVQALSTGISAVNVTPRPVRAIDGPDREWFYERWKHWFAQAATGALTHPGGMPETYR